MSNEECKRKIMEMLNGINDNVSLYKIYKYIQRIFLKRTE